MSHFRDELINVLVNDYSEQYENIKNLSLEELNSLLNPPKEYLCESIDELNYQTELNMLVNDYGENREDLIKKFKNNKKEIINYSMAFGKRDENDIYIE